LNRSDDPWQKKETYLARARDALAAGDWIEAERNYQNAEHYQRIINGSDEQE
jgi:hypothetical protein